jgi:hypothetical protein
METSTLRAIKCPTLDYFASFHIVATTPADTEIYLPSIRIVKIICILLRIKFHSDLWNHVFGTIIALRIFNISMLLIMHNQL